MRIVKSERCRCTGVSSVLASKVIALKDDSARISAEHLIAHRQLVRIRNLTDSIVNLFNFFKQYRNSWAV